MYKGFVKVAAAVPVVRVADCHYNAMQTETLMVKAESMGVEVVCFPELNLTSYTCQDLFFQQMLLDEAESALLRIVSFSRNLKVAAIVGLPFVYEGKLYDCAAIVQGGKVHGFVPKTYLAGNAENNEHRWFSSAENLPADAKVMFCGQNVPISSSVVFQTGHCSFSVEIGTDLWSLCPPSTKMSQLGAEVIFSPASMNEQIGRYAYVRQLVQMQSARCQCGYVSAGSGFGESVQDQVYGGYAFVAENGSVLSEAARFMMEEQLIVSEIDVEALRHERRTESLFAASHCAGQSFINVEIPMEAISHSGKYIRTIKALPFVPADNELNKVCEEILFIQSQGLAARILHTHAKTVVVGISGGLDSTLALLVCVYAFDRLKLDRKGIIGITMPGFGTTDRTYTNAVRLMKNLGVTIREISIRDACEVHFRDLAHDPSLRDVTYENSQARERTQILMDAANQMNGFVVGTGDLSELALGWATYNGDHMSMYGVNASVPKTLVGKLVTWMAEHVVDSYCRAILLDIVATPISPELIPADEQGEIVQKTENLVGPYELHDFFLYHTLRHGRRPSSIFALALQAFDGSQGPSYDASTIKHWMTIFFRRFFAQQFKRNCLPDGPKVGRCSLSPRGNHCMPSDAMSTIWLEECENLSI